MVFHRNDEIQIFLISSLTRSESTFRLMFKSSGNRNPGHVASFHSLLFKQKFLKRKNVKFPGVVVNSSEVLIHSSFKIKLQK